MGKVFVTGNTVPGKLYRIDPSQPAGAVTTASSSLGGLPIRIAFDGQQIWTANEEGSVSIITLPSFALTTVSTGFTALRGIIFDGSNIWVTNDTSGSVDKLHKLNANGSIALSVNVGSSPLLPAFDGANIWVPNSGSNSITVVRASTGVVLATLTGNGVNSPSQAAFDGERILVTNTGGDSVSLWKATDLSVLGTFPTGASTAPFGACSDGVNFWITLTSAGKLARF